MRDKGALGALADSEDSRGRRSSFVGGNRWLLEFEMSAHGKDRSRTAGAVNFVLSGHEHNYQRTVPLRFTPKDMTKARAIHTKDRVVTGDFKLDLAFDGEKTTKANGVIYITTGAGGKYLYDPEYNNAPEKWVIPEDGNLAFTTKMVSDRHSLTVFDVERDEVLLRQIDEQGNEIDRIRVTA